MAASYPSAVKTFTDVTDSVDDVEATQINQAYDEIEAIETELGTTPSGSSTTVKARLDGTGEVEIADDAATSFTPPNPKGIVIVYGTNDGNKTYNGVFAYRCAATTFLAAIASNNLTVTTGALTGEDGVDTEMTVSCHTDNKIYLENRTGAAVYMAMVATGS